VQPLKLGHLELVINSLLDLGRDSVELVDHPTAVAVSLACNLSSRFHRGCTTGSRSPSAPCRDDRTEEIGTGRRDVTPLVALVGLVAKASSQIVGQLADLCLLPAVFALVVGEPLLTIGEQLRNGSCRAGDLGNID
jgi:hypothetical protein